MGSSWLAVLLWGCNVCLSTHEQGTISAMEAAQADFALNLLRQAGNRSQSSILSPVSVAIALAISYAGARGNTRREMNAVLANGVRDDDTFHRYFEETLRSLSERQNSEGEMVSANKVFVNDGFDLIDDFVATVSDKYGECVETTDFSRPQLAAEKINEWVEEQTNSKIKQLVSPKMFTRFTRLVLVNGVYFKARWQSPFYETQTADRLFHQAKNRQKTVQMMKAFRVLPHFGDEVLQVVGLNYDFDNATMYVFLPNERYGLDNLKGSLNGRKMLELIASCVNVLATVQIPKFELETSVALVETLQKLGIHDAFDDQEADFSGISADMIYISDVIHKTFLKVTEKGTEAAAATSVVGGAFKSAGVVIPKKRIVFVADHPFMFAIVKKNIVLFIGQFR